MKHSQISILMLSALATVSGLLSACSSDEDEALLQPSSKTVTVTAGIDTDATRIALGESDGSSTKVLWSPNEQIALVAGDASYTFTRSDEGTDNVASADFSYTGDLPAFTSEAYFRYPATQPTSWATQPGTAEGLAQYMTLRADLPEGTDSYDGLNLHFTHETAVVKVTLTSKDFAWSSVYLKLSATDLLGEGINSIETEYINIDNGEGLVTAYFVVPASDKELSDLVLTVSDSYTINLGAKTIEAGKLYKLNREYESLVADINLSTADAVDLGLSVKWASHNLGASSITDYGEFYAWSSDIVQATWGGNWRMPTSAEVQELIDKCILVWGSYQDVRGMYVIGPNGNSIFMRSAYLEYIYTIDELDGSYMETGNIYDHSGEFWTSTQTADGNQEYCFYCQEDGFWFTKSGTYNPSAQIKLPNGETVGYSYLNKKNYLPRISTLDAVYDYWRKPIRPVCE